MNKKILCAALVARIATLEYALKQQLNGSTVSNGLRSSFDDWTSRTEITRNLDFKDKVRLYTAWINRQADEIEVHQKELAELTNEPTK